MVVYISLFALFVVGPHTVEPCDTSCEALIERAVHWVADTRQVDVRDIVVVPRSNGSVPQDADYVTALRRAAGRAGARVSTQVPVACAASAEDLESRCKMLAGKVLVRINAPPKLVDGNGSLEIMHVTYGKNGSGRIHVLHFSTTGDGWRFVRAVAVAAS